MFLKNRNIISKIKRSKVTDYAALTRPVGSDYRLGGTDGGGGGGGHRYENFRAQMRIC